MSQISNTVIENENKFWSLVFKNEFDNSNNKLYSHYWWQKYYESITKYVTNYCSITESSQILEPGCGSGKASILLGKNIPRTLLDISPEALKYAQIVSKRFKTKQIKFELGDVFNLRKYYSAYDLVWNIGVVEHYSLEQIEKIFIEMVCCTKPGGFVSFGVPNFWTGATLKAYLLTLPIINKIAGYRLDSENFYSEKILNDLMGVAITKSKRKTLSCNITYHGNPLNIEALRILQDSIGLFLAKIIPKSQFLSLYTYKIN